MAQENPKGIPVDVEGVGRIYFPAGYTPERIKFSIENDILPRIKKADFATPEAPTGLERLGRGFADVTEGVKQGGLMLKDLITGGNEADAYTAEKTADIDLYERGRAKSATRLSDLVQGKRGDPGIDWMRLGGNVLATAPAMLIPGGAQAALGTRVLAGAGQGALASGSMFTPEGESKGEQIATGALIGGAIPAAIYGAQSASGKVMDLIRPGAQVNVSPTGPLAGQIEIKLQQQGVDWGKLTDDVKTSLLKDAKSALQSGGTLDDAMLRNKALIESIGAKPTKASVSRAPRDWQTEKNLRGIQGVGDDLVAREQTNAQAMIDYMEKISAKTGARGRTPYEAGESAIKALKAQDAAKESAVSDLYQAFRESGTQWTRVPQERLTNALGKVIDDIGLDNVPPSVVSRLKEFGFLDSKATKLLTIADADAFNRLLNNNNPGFGPQSKAIGILKNALNQSLLDIPDGAGAQGAQALIKARSAAAQRFAEADSSKGIAAALDDVSPDRFLQKFVIGADVKDVTATVNELRKSAQGNQAIANLKGSVLDGLLMKATGATNIDDVAGKAFSGVRFGKALDAITPEKLHALFTPSEVESLRTLQKASKLLTEEVPFSDVNHSKTTAALANLLQKIGSTPMLGPLLSPIIGTGKIGMDWVKDAAARKQVAEVLIGSAGKAGQKMPLPPPSGRVADFARFAPGAAAGVLTDSSQRPDY